MNKIIAVCIATAGLFAAGTLNPHHSRAAQMQSINMEEIVKFQQDSADLRGEIVVKKLELIGEAMRQPADSARVKALAQEVIALQTQIAALANKHGLPGPSAFQNMIRSTQQDLTGTELEALRNIP